MFHEKAFMMLPLFLKQILFQDVCHTWNLFITNVSIFLYYILILQQQQQFTDLVPCLHTLPVISTKEISSLLKRNRSYQKFFLDRDTQDHNGTQITIHTFHKKNKKKHQELNQSLTLIISVLLLPKNTTKLLQ